MQQTQEIRFASLWQKKRRSAIGTLKKPLFWHQLLKRKRACLVKEPVAQFFTGSEQDAASTRSNSSLWIRTSREKVDRLLRRHWDHNSPWNTYRVNGLPPTPICNPGTASLEAVLNPKETGYYYFVANGKGGHAFAKTLAEHNRNVKAWQRIKKVNLNRPPHEGQYSI